MEKREGREPALSVLWLQHLQAKAKFTGRSEKLAAIALSNDQRGFTSTPQNEPFRAEPWNSIHLPASSES
ncbi:MAG: hypothetical protein CMJ89_13960 [Planctomycetes bacterium]|nr:hypothetical protein [Planctomycetota bacterium]